MSMKKVIKVPKTVEKVVEKVTEMKTEIQTVDEDGFEMLLGQQIVLFCVNYIYAGELIGVNGNKLLLKELKNVYETGDFSKSSWQDAQKVADEGYVLISAIEAFAKGK